MKRVIAVCVLLFTVLTVGYVTMFISKNSSSITSTRRPSHEQLDIVYIDDAAIALAGSPSADPEMRKLAVDAYEQTNAYRVSKGLKSLVWSERLAQDAIVRAEEIEQLFSHQRPNRTDWWTVDSEYMYGENLAQGFTTSDSVVQAWIDSPSHRENLEEDEFITCGISAWRGADGNIYIAQEFGY